MEKVIVEPFSVIGLAIRTTNADGQGVKDIAALWQKFMINNILDKIPNKVDNTIYSLYTDYDGDYTKPYLTLLGCKVENLDEVPEGMTGKLFLGGDYLKITAKGNLSEDIVANEWIKIWSTDLDRAYVADFEVYGEKSLKPENAEVDIFIGVNSFPIK